jgi:integrase
MHVACTTNAGRFELRIAPNRPEATFRNGRGRRRGVRRSPQAVGRQPASLRRSYAASLEKHIYPELGARKLSSITFPHMQDFCDRLASEGLDVSTIRNTVNPLRRMFKKHRYSIPVNPTTGLEIVAARNKPKRIATPDDAARMIDALPPEDRPIWGTAFYAGLRNGELQALRVEDLDLFEGWGLLHVAGGWDKVEGVVDPKSDAGKRTIPIPEPLYAILDEHLLRLNRTEGLIFRAVTHQALLLQRGAGAGRAGLAQGGASGSATA